MLQKWECLGECYKNGSSVTKMGVSNKSLEIAIKVTKCEKQSFPGRVRRAEKHNNPTAAPIITRDYREAAVTGSGTTS